jgi:hypothetical protein
MKVDNGGSFFPTDNVIRSGDCDEYVEYGNEGIDLRTYIAFHCKREDYEPFLNKTRIGAFDDNEPSKIIIARFAYASEFIRLMRMIGKNEE